jgi:hypothetical protein
MLKYAQVSIKKGRYTELQRALNKTFKAQKKTPLKPAALLDHVISIIDRYYDPAETEEEGIEDLHAGLTTADLQPVIILSESFAG